MPRRLTKNVSENDSSQPGPSGVNGKYICPGCGNDLEYKYRYDPHVRSCTHFAQPPSVTCEECGREVARSELAVHVVVHHLPPNALTCTYGGCNKTVSRRDKMRAHLERVHADLRTHTCEVCGNVFKDRSNLVNHMKKLHGLHQVAKKEKQVGESVSLVEAMMEIKLEEGEEENYNFEREVDEEPEFKVKKKEDKMKVKDGEGGKRKKNIKAYKNNEENGNVKGQKKKEKKTDKKKNKENNIKEAKLETDKVKKKTAK